ncbi:flagellar biosynthesis anti-sigma factor FlgM [Sphingobium nicotianae]|uniref:Negative regulator of flagellin synthesis n=1 Tax=Sphingobium nicotianae TaxID=2782607 RepID=A0A9X1IR21_9SPHN|nr:flagellar biosynthesis anti-sigma factor FlgM [Sphingobium nicotianae]MBT2187066.1 flagellar biosynthesis anti-sigma factor FlgM [Sphingobium nicotianae]
MIKSVGQSLNAAIEAARLRETAQSRSTAKVTIEAAATESVATTVQTPAARMAAQGAPIDLARISRIKQAIASGNYPVDPDKIAEKMIDLDLPVEKY